MSLPVCVCLCVGVWVCGCVFGYTLDIKTFYHAAHSGGWLPYFIVAWEMGWTIWDTAVMCMSTGRF